MPSFVQLLRAGLAATAVLAATCVAAQAQETVRIAPREKITNFFAGAELDLHLDVSATQAMKGTVVWRLSAHGRTIASREAAIEVRPDKPAAVAIRHKLPPVNEGVIFPLQLRATVTADKAGEPLGQFDETLYLFASNPFADRQEWLKSLSIHLFDPVESTAKTLDALEIPYASVTNLETLSDLARGVLIVGEGIAWDNYGNLGKMLLAAAGRGVTVICLSPAAAEFTLPLAASDDAAVAAGISLRRRDVVRELDKRFALVWSANRAIELRELAIVAERDAALARAVEPGHGWPWVEIRYAKPGGRLLWCGLDLVRSWDESPTPRYLFSRLLETLPAEESKPSTSRVHN